jgi:Tfp pilus assembly protein PilV
MHDVKKTFTVRVDDMPSRKPAPKMLAAPNRCATRRTGRAFTILEVMMAATVMALALTTSITTMQRGFLSLDTARNITIAGQILQCEVEKMRMVPWGTINAYAASTPNLAIEENFKNNPAVKARFTLSRTVTDVPTSTNVPTSVTTTPDGMKEMTFTVSWTSYDGRPLSRSYTTYYGQKGLYDYYFNSI